MSAKHTPGPWTVAYYASQDGKGGTSHYAVKYGAETICRSAQQVADERDEANARLIAAAPDLLNALRTLAGLCEDRGLYPLNVREARYAILRATA